MTVDLSRMDTPLSVLTLQLAAIRTTSVSAKCAFALDAWLITHPEVPVATDADYPAWAAALAAKSTYRRTKEAS
jgi:hypothetical protein